MVFHRDLVECTQYLICTHDLQGQILSLIQEGARLLGYGAASRPVATFRLVGLATGGLSR
jgi:hypothetical protein